jgi:hypothetical protein
MISGRQYATKVVGTVITFECERAGHTYTIDMASRRRKLPQRLSPAAAQHMASWWSREKGGCVGECPKCQQPTTGKTITDLQVQKLFEKELISEPTYRGALLVVAQHGSLGRNVRRECRAQCAEVYNALKVKP